MNFSRRPRGSPPGKLQRCIGRFIKCGAPALAKAQMSLISQMAGGKSRRRRGRRGGSEATFNAAQRSFWALSPIFWDFLDMAATPPPPPTLLPHPKPSGAQEPLINGGEKKGRAVDVVSHAGGWVTLQLMQRASAGGGWG